MVWLMKFCSSLTSVQYMYSHLFTDFWRCIIRQRNSSLLLVFFIVFGSFLFGLKICFECSPFCTDFFGCICQKGQNLLVFLSFFFFNFFWLDLLLLYITYDFPSHRNHIWSGSQSGLLMNKIVQQEYCFHGLGSLLPWTEVYLRF